MPIHNGHSVLLTFDIFQDHLPPDSITVIVIIHKLMYFKAFKLLAIFYVLFSN